MSLLLSDAQPKMTDSGQRWWWLGCVRNVDADLVEPLIFYLVGKR